MMVFEGGICVFMIVLFFGLILEGFVLDYVFGF